MRKGLFIRKDCPCGYPFAWRRNEACVSCFTYQGVRRVTTYLSVCSEHGPSPHRIYADRWAAKGTCTLCAPPLDATVNPR